MQGTGLGNELKINNISNSSDKKEIEIKVL